MSHHDSESPAIPGPSLAYLDTEKSRDWENVAGSNPKRIINALIKLTSKTKSSSEDNSAIVHEILIAVSTLALQNGSMWRRLVDGGIADVLCQNVIDNSANLLPPSMLNSTEHSEKPSLPLEALRNAACTSTMLSPNPVYPKTLAAVKKKWSEMMSVVWKEPGNALTPAARIANGRLVADMLSSIIHADASFLSIVDKDSDLTPQVLTRYLVSSTSSSDSGRAASSLFELFYPKEKSSSYRQTNPNPLTYVRRILEGASSAAALLDSVSARLMDAHLRDVHDLLGVLTQLDRLAQPRNPDYLRTFRQHELLWRAIFAYASRAAQEDPTGSQCLAVILLTGQCMTHCEVNAEDELSALLTLWVRTGIFDALEVVVPVCKDAAESNTVVIRIICQMYLVASANPALFRNEFPRPRLMRALLVSACETEDPVAKVVPDIMQWGHTGWMTLYSMERLCIPPETCARRTCGRRASARCSKCRAAAYCGTECQRTDWKLHKLVCGLQIARAKDGDPDGPADIIMPFIDRK